jgi:RNA polymerase sigma-70 factor, ECF subfamily
VRRTSEVIDVRERPIAVDRLTEREAAFLRLADQHLDAAYRLARAILRDTAEAEDATHDAFVVAWRKWSSLRDPARFDAWFNRILVNTCRNRLLRTSRTRTTDISGEIAISGADAFAQAHDRDLLANAIAGLSADPRLVVVLRFYLDLPVEEIARRLDIPVGTGPHGGRAGRAASGGRVPC